MPICVTSKRAATMVAALFLTYPGLAQTGTIGPTQDTATNSAGRGSEMDHMAQLVTRLKSDVRAIQDPAAKKAAMENLELWRHLLDQLERENPSANNSAPEHHHEEEEAPAALKQSAKPP